MKRNVFSGCVVLWILLGTTGTFAQYRTQNPQDRIHSIFNPKHSYAQRNQAAHTLLQQLQTQPWLGGTKLLQHMLTDGFKLAQDAPALRVNILRVLLHIVPLAEGSRIWTQRNAQRLRVWQKSKDSQLQIAALLLQLVYCAAPQRHKHASAPDFMLLQPQDLYKYLLIRSRECHTSPISAPMTTILRKALLTDSTHRRRWIEQLLFDSKRSAYTWTQTRRMLHSAVAQERQRAVHNLQWLGTKVHTTLLQWLQGTNSKQRILAAFALFSLPRTVLGSQLIAKIEHAFLTHKFDRKPTLLWYFLRSIQPQTRLHKRVLQRIYMLTFSRQPSVRVEALRVLQRHPQATAHLLRVLQRKVRSKQWRQRKEVFSLLALQKKSQNVFRAYKRSSVTHSILARIFTRGFRDRHIRVRAEALLASARWIRVKALFKWRKVFRFALQHRSWRVRYAAAEGSRHLGQQVMQIQRELLRASGDSNWGVRHASSFALARIGPRCIRPMLRLWKGASIRQKMTYMDVLFRMKAYPSQGLKLIFKGLKERRLVVRYTALRALRQWKGQLPSKYRAALLRKLSDPDWRIREHTAHVFKKLSPTRTQMLRLLHVLQKDPNASVRKAALLTLHVQEKLMHKRVVKALAHSLNDRNAQIQWTGLRFLAQYSSFPNALKAHSKLWKKLHTHPQTRIRILSLLVRLKLHGRGVFSHLLRAQSTGWKARKYMMYLLDKKQEKPSFWVHSSTLNDLQSITDAWSHVFPQKKFPTPAKLYRLLEGYALHSDRSLQYRRLTFLHNLLNKPNLGLTSYRIHHPHPWIRSFNYTP